MKANRIGVAVLDGKVRAVGLRDGRVVWAASASAGEGGSIVEPLANLLAEAPRPGMRRPVVVIAVGPARSQVRRLSGLPPGTGARTADAIVANGVSRFFLSNGIPLLPGHSVPGADGMLWGSVFEAPLVSDALDACRRARLSCEGLIPAVAVLDRGRQAAEAVLRDGETTVAAKLQGHRLAAVTRVAPGPEQLPGLPVEALAPLGEEACSYTEAYGAAVAELSAVPGLCPGRALPEGPIPPWRKIAAAGALTLAMLSAAAGPGVAARARAAKAERMIAALEPRALSTFDARAQAVRFAAARDEFRTLARLGGPPRTAVLWWIAGALPDSAALTTLRIDGAGAQMTVLAPRIGPVIARLEKAADILSPQIVGPVTREVVAAHERERATVSFRLP